MGNAFFLGVGEGGMYPATLVLLSHWFPSKERARGNGWFSLAVPLSLVISTPLSGWLIHRWNWRVMLIVEGLLPLTWLLVWIFGVYDYPREAPWISREEREFLETTYERETAARQPARRENYWRSILAPQVLLLALIKLLMLSAQLGYTIWLPSAIEKARSISSLRSGVLNAIPFVIGAISLLYNSMHSDRRRERRAHMAIPMAIGGVALLGGIATMSRCPTLAFALVCLVAIGTFAPLGPFWAVSTEWFSRKMAGSVAGFINGVGNLGGFFGPLLVGYLSKRFGSFVPGFTLLGGFMLIGAALPFFLKPPPNA